MAGRRVQWSAVVGWALAIVSTSILAWHLFEEWRVVDEEPEIVEREDRIVLRNEGFSNLDGWESDEQSDAIRALRRTCERLATFPPEREVGGLGGTVSDWTGPCSRLSEVQSGDDQAARTFFEAEFQIFSVSNHDERTGLFTGYYEPSIAGTRELESEDQVPLYRRPDDLVAVDLGEFREDLGGRRVAGRLDGRKLRPYQDRAEISAGALTGQELELAWINNPVDAFFLHIQGSGRVDLPGGEVLRVGYDGQNGHPYFPIGRDLVERGVLILEEVSMQSIRAWLEANPEVGVEVMNRNASFVFFRELEGEGPIGTLGVALTPGRSLAVDRQFLPLGAPVWIEGTVPGLEAGSEEHFARLMVAQDTGGAIKGPVRGDVFWGNGDEAAERAGRMRNEGRLWLLLPRAVSVREEVLFADG